MLWQSNYRLLSCWANSRTLSVNPPVTQAPTLGHCHYTQPTPWCAGQPRHTLFTSFMMRLELEVLGVSQTGFLLFVCLFNLWGNWGPEQWLKQCRAREEIWDLGKGGWCVKVSLLPSFPPSLFYFISSLLFPPFPPLFLSFNEHHPLRIYIKEFEEEKYHWTKKREYQQGGVSWMTSVPKASQ